MAGFRNAMMGAAGAAGAGGYSVDNSIVLDDGSSQYLSRTVGTGDNNGKTFTFSCWVKRGNLSTQQTLISAGSTTHETEWYFNSSDQLVFTFRTSSTGGFTTNELFRDPHAWYHLILAVDTTQATATNRARLWINGSEITSFSSYTNIAQNNTSNMFETGQPLYLGADQTPGNYGDFYMSEVVGISDSQITDATSFGEYDTNGVWRPISIEDAGLTFGNNGFYMPMTTASGLGQDYSGNTTANIAQQNTYVGTSNTHSGDASEFKQILIADFSGKIPKIDFFARENAWSGVTVRIETNTGSGPGDATGTLVDSNAEITNVSGSNNAYVTATFPNGGPEVVAGTQYWIVIENGTFGFAALSPAGTSVGQIGYYADSSYSTTVGLSHRVYFTGNNFMSRSPTSGAAGYTSHGPSQSSDSPTNNHCVMSPIDKSSAITMSNGNLTVTNPSTSSWNHGRGSLFVSSGKWYYEWTPTAGTYALAGWMLDVSGNDYVEEESDVATTYYRGVDSGGAGFRIAGAATDASVTLFGLNDVVMMAIDVDTMKMWVGINGTWYNSGDPANGTNPVGTWTAAIGESLAPWYGCINTTSETFNFGASAFAHTPPTGFNAWNTTNLVSASAPAIEDGSAHFQTSTWSGNSGSQTVAQSGNSTFKPDMVWIKDRDFGNIANIFDAVRAQDPSNKGLAIDAGAEDTNSDGVTLNAGSIAFTGGGNTGDINESGRTYVGWEWLGANGTATPSGSSGISSLVVSANTTAGFSVGTFTAQSSGSTGVVAHGLGGQADWIVVKPRATSAEGNDWTVWHSGIDSTTSNTTRTFLNNNSSSGTGGAAIAAAGTTTFTIPDDGYYHDRNFAFYAWRSIPGFSKFGSFEGNNSTDGSLITLDFSPAWVMVKNVDTSTGGNWWTVDSARDSYNPADKELILDGTSTEDYDMSAVMLDFGSNFFKMRCSGAGSPNSANTFIYAAFAVHPFAATTPATAR